MLCIRVCPVLVVRHRGDFSLRWEIASRSTRSQVIDEGRASCRVGDPRGLDGSARREGLRIFKEPVQSLDGPQYAARKRHRNPFHR